MNDGVGGEGKQEEGGEAGEEASERDAHGPDEAWRSDGNMACRVAAPQWLVPPI
jgi:hypothetical protein